jgi:hypothetical protein
LKDWYTKNDFGIDLKMPIKCQHCDFETESQEIRIDSNFF